MGRLILDKKSKELIDNDLLSKESKLLWKDAQFIAEKTDDNIFIAVDLNDIKYHNDLSTMVISEVIGDKIYTLECYNENYYK